MNSHKQTDRRCCIGGKVLGEEPGDKTVNLIFHIYSPYQFFIYVRFYFNFVILIQAFITCINKNVIKCMVCRWCVKIFSVYTDTLNLISNGISEFPLHLLYHPSSLLNMWFKYMWWIYCICTFVMSTVLSICFTYTNQKETCQNIVKNEVRRHIRR